MAENGIVLTVRLSNERWYNDKQIKQDHNAMHYDGMIGTVSGHRTESLSDSIVY